HPHPLVVDVRGDVLQSARQVEPFGQVVGAPTGGDQGVERVGEQSGIVRTLSKLDGLERERRTAGGVVAVDPPACLRRREASSRNGGFRGSEIGLVEQCRRTSSCATESLK